MPIQSIAAAASAFTVTALISKASVKKAMEVTVGGAHVSDQGDSFPYQPFTATAQLKRCCLPVQWAPARPLE